MSSEIVCRLCLKIDIPVRALSKTPLQEVYEKLTNGLLITACKPAVACSHCHWQLKKCHQLMIRSMRADELLTNILQTGASINRELISTIDRKIYKLEDNLGISPMELNIVMIPGHNIEEDNVKNEPLSYQNKEDLDSAQMIDAGIIKLENSEDKDIETENFLDINNFVNEELIDEEGIIHEVREGAEDIKDEIDIDEINFETLDDLDDDVQVEGAGPALKCDVKQSSHVGTQDTIAVQQQDNTASRKIDIEEAQFSNIYRNTTEDSIRKKLDSTSRYCTVVLNKINIDIDNKHSSAEYICDICGDLYDSKYLLMRHIARHNSIKDIKQSEYNAINKMRLRTKHLSRDMKSHSSNKTIECEICQKIFKSASNLYQHSKMHSDEKPFKCSVCPKRFKTRSHLKRHLKTHTEDMDVECIICSKKFTKKFKLEFHLLSHFEENVYQCETCGKRLKTKDNLRRHLETHTKKLFPCPRCRYSFANKPSLESHISRVHSTECPICKKTIKIKSDLKKHLKTHTGEKPFQCHICENRFIDRGNLNRHLKIHSGVQPFQCEVCPKKFTARSTLNTHLEKHFGIRNPFECGICFKIFSRNYALKAHLKTHSREKVEKKFECSICQSRWQCKSSLIIHLRSHSGEKPFECEICLKRFSRKGDVRKHLKGHSEERPVECAICQRRFKDKQAIVQHLKTHSWEKPFECTMCHKGFIHKGDLKRHLETHTGVKSFKCEVCQKWFRRNKDLNTHFKRHTREKPFKCEICQKDFSVRSDLKQHSKIHTGEKIFECAICQKQYKSRHNLIVHLRSHSG